MRFGKQNGHCRRGLKGGDVDEDMGMGGRHGRGGGRRMGRGMGRGPDGAHGDGKGVRQGRGRGGRGGRRMFDANELRLVILHLLDQEPRHGYDVIRAVGELSAGGYAPSPGVVYPALSLLEDIGQIEVADSAGSKKSFSLTDDGRKELAENADVIKVLLTRLEMLADKAHKLNAAPIKRAMTGVKLALGDKMDQENSTDETVHAIAAILDEAAQKIERL